jgi:stress response protein YsnF
LLRYLLPQQCLVPPHRCAEEQVSVEKRPVLNVELSVGKQKMQDTQQGSVTVRREEARIEGTGEVTLRRASSDYASRVSR